MRWLNELRNSPGYIAVCGYFCMDHTAMNLSHSGLAMPRSTLHNVSSHRRKAELTDVHAPEDCTAGKKGAVPSDESDSKRRGFP